VLARTPAQAVQLAGDLYQYGYDPRRLCRDLLEHFRHLVAAKISAEPVLLGDLPDHEVTIVRQQAEGCSLEDLQRFFTLLLHTDEELSKTAHPQLVIEMALVKLASQPPIVPIEEALARLESLQKALLGHAPAQTAAAQVVQPNPPAASSSASLRAAARIQREDRSPASPSPLANPPTSTPDPALRTIPAPAIAGGDELEAWEGFLRAVRREKISLFFPLKSAVLLALTQTALRIGVEKDLYFRELNRKESRSLLEDIARRFFGRSIAIDITKGRPEMAASVAATEPLAANTPAVQVEQEQPAAADPLVQTVLDVLGGEVQGTRSHRPSGEPR
jgi:DNA polymerase-3 subunit gamma/tau